MNCDYLKKLRLIFPKLTDKFLRLSLFRATVEIEFGAGDGADGLGHLHAGLFAEATADTVVGVDVGLFVEAELHGFSGKRTGAVADAAGAARERITEVGGEEGEPHVDGEATFFIGF